MRKGLMLVLALALVLAPCAAFAATSGQIAVTVTITQSVSVTVTPNAYAFGATSESATLATAADAFTATNDGNGKENLGITVADSANWQAATAAAKDAFVMNYSTNGTTWNLITPVTGAQLATNVAKSANQKFGLQLLVPTSTDFGGAQQTIGVTVTAQAS